MVVHPEIGQPSTEALRRRLDGVSRADANRYVDAAAIVESMFGDETVTNLFLVGVAVQAGALSLRPESIERAVELNGGRRTQHRGVPLGAQVDRRPRGVPQRHVEGRRPKRPVELRASARRRPAKRLAGLLFAVSRWCSRAGVGPTVLTDAVAATSTS
jgi:hypothetical protein